MKILYLTQEKSSMILPTIGFKMEGIIKVRETKTIQNLKTKWNIYNKVKKDKNLEDQDTTKTLIDLALKKKTILTLENYQDIDYKNKNKISSNQAKVGKFCLKAEAMYQEAILIKAQVDLSFTQHTSEMITQC